MLVTVTNSSDLRMIYGIRVGQLVGFQDTYVPLVIFEGQRGSAALAARTLADLRSEHIGDDVVVMCENGDPQRPLVIESWMDT